MISVRSLPDGYRVRVIEGRVYVFDPRGNLLPGPKDPSLIEAYAWRHAWRRIARELNEEVADVHAGVRSLHGARRLRQYMRMMDAVNEAARPGAARPARVSRVAWGIALAEAAAIAGIFLTAPFWAPQGPDNYSLPAPTIQRLPTMAGHRAGPTGAGAARVASSPRGGETARGAAQRGQIGSHRPGPGQYAISFGTYVNRTTADAMMHFVRSKGYVAYVARVGEEFRVVTHPYRTRDQAERMVAALQEINLPAQLANAHEI